MKILTIQLENEIINFGKALKDNFETISKTYSDEVGYSVEDISLLWNDLDNFLQNFSQLFEGQQKIWEIKNVFYQNIQKKFKYQISPWGKVLICTPQNAVIPLVPIMIISFCSVGNELVIAPSRKTIKTFLIIFKIAKETLISKFWKFDFFEEGGKSAIDKYVKTRVIDFLYFQGSSKNRIPVINQCLESGIDYIFEGEGNQITFIDNIYQNTFLDSVVNKIHRSKEMCQGQLCTSPNVIFVDEKCSSEFLLKCKIRSSEIEVYILEETLNLASMINKELLTNKILIIIYKDFNRTVDRIKYIYNFGLQVSIFSENPDRLKVKLLKELKIARIMINLNPTFQNSLLPWGGYKKTGFSPVYNFIEKAIKVVTIEG